MKRLFFLITILLSVNINMFAQTFEVNELEYTVNIDKKTATVSKKLYTFPSGDIVIPSSVSYNSEIYAVTHIGKEAFMGCKNLKSIVLPANLINIGKNAFRFCSGITNIIIPESVINIDEWAFGGCHNLQTIKIPTSVKNITERAFHDCQNLKSINVDKENLYYSSYDGVLYNKNITSLLQFPGGLSSINIPETVQYIDNYAFWSCINLTSIELPENITSLGVGVFIECSNLQYVTLPSKLMGIPISTFEKCNNIREIKCKMVKPIYLHSEDFESEVYIFAKLIVPIGSKSLYEADNNWGRFVNIEESDINVSNENIQMDNSTVEITVQNGGILVNTLKSLEMKIYTIDGELKKNLKISNSEFINLVPNIYILSYDGYSKKIIVK